MNTRAYSDDDFEACLRVFDSNVPDFFVLEERQEFSTFLRDLPGPYLVIEDDHGDVVGCGGYAINQNSHTADLCWGMVLRRLHRRGLGRRLTELRVEQARKDISVREIALGTSQHTVAFYEGLGFRTVEVVRDGYGTGLDRCEMRLPVEVARSGGGRTSVVRRGDAVHRAAGPWSTTVLDLLRHLERVGFDGAPRVLGLGFDSAGREVVTYLEGQFVHPRSWTEDALPEVGALLRRLHEATGSFAPPRDAVWAAWHGRDLGEANAVIGHCDAGPWNIVARDGNPVALIDWETAGPVDPVVELAQACWLNAQLHDDDVAERQGLAPATDRAHHVRLILDGYELPADRRRGFVDRMIEFAVQDAAAEADDNGDETSWGVTWRKAGAAWMERHRSLLEAALI